MSNKPVWSPDAKRIKSANMNRFIRFVSEQTGDADINNYPSLYDFSIHHAEKFWPLVWDFCGIRASGEFEPVIVDSDKLPGATFYPNVSFNFAQNLLRFKDDKTAIIFRDESGQKRQLSYAELHVEVARCQQALKTAGVTQGDRVACFMPNLIETLITMLATTSLGAIFSSCSPDFGINGVIDRFGQIEPKVLVTADAYRYNGKTYDCLAKIKEVTDHITSIKQLLVVPYINKQSTIANLPNAILWPEALDNSASKVEFTQVPFNHPVYIMYSSGTTGVPKCIVHGGGGVLLQHLKEHVLHTDLKREDKLFYFTTCGWMMWNWLVSGLATGATIVLYEGSPSYPEMDSLWDMADELDISIFGTSAKWLSAIEKAGVKPHKTHKLNKLKAILSTGSPLMPESYDYVYRDVKPEVMLSSISGGTDIVSCFALGNPILPVYRGQLQSRGLGLAVEALGEDGQPVRGQPGELSCLKPFPCMPIKFWNDPDGERYHDAYFAKQPGVWSHGDFIEITPEDGVIIYGRSDATLNPGGVRIGTAEIYRQVDKLDEILESVAVGYPKNGDQYVILFVKLRTNITLDEDLETRIKTQIRTNTTPRHVPKAILQVTDIPHTISGKTSEVAVGKAIQGQTIKNSDALANPESLQQYIEHGKTLASMFA